MYKNSSSNISVHEINIHFEHSIYKLQRRRFGSSRRPGERITLGGGGHGHYPLDYDYYDTGDDHNLIFYQHNSIGNYQHTLSNKY